MQSFYLKDSWLFSIFFFFIVLPFYFAFDDELVKSSLPACLYIICLLKCYEKCFLFCHISFLLCTRQTEFNYETTKRFYQSCSNKYKMIWIWIHENFSIDWCRFLVNNNAQPIHWSLNTCMRAQMSMNDVNLNWSDEDTKKKHLSEFRLWICQWLY